MKNVIIKAGATFEEVISISRTVTSIDHVGIIQVGALFLGAKASGNKELEDLCRSRLNSDSQTESCVRFVVNRLYGKYGVDELMYLYQEYSYDDIYAMVRSQVDTLWNELKWDYVSNYLSDTRSWKNAFFMNHFLQLRVTGLYCKQIYSLAKERFPKLTFGGLRRYIQMRKATGYAFQFSRYTNTELNRMLVSAEMDPLTEETLNKYRIMFGYEPEPDTRPLKEQPAWKAAHRNELLFWKKTKADTIVQTEQDAFIDYLRSDFDFSDDELADLVNWLMIARYEGRVNDCIPTCTTLNMRYANVKRMKEGKRTKVSPIREMRYEILMHCDVNSVPEVFVNTLSNGIDGHLKGQINKRFA